MHGRSCRAECQEILLDATFQQLGSNRSPKRCNIMFLLQNLHSRHQAWLVSPVSVYKQNLINAIMDSGKRCINQHGSQGAHAQGRRAREIHVVRGDAIGDRREANHFMAAAASQKLGNPIGPYGIGHKCGVGSMLFTGTYRDKRYLDLRQHFSHFRPNHVLQNQTVHFLIPPFQCQWGLSQIFSFCPNPFSRALL